MSVRKSLAWSYGAQALIFVITFASSVVVARLLGPYQMGVFAIAMATSGVLSILSAFGVGPYLIRHEALDARTTTTVFTVNVVLNVIVAAAIALTAWLGPVFGMATAVRHVLLLIALVPLIGIFEFMPSTLLQREMNFKASSIINVGRSLVTSVVVVLLAFLGFGSLSPALALVAASVYAAVVYSVIGRRHVTVRLGLHGWREVTRFGFHMMSVGGVASIAQRLSEIALGRIQGLAPLGIYVRASGLANQVWDNVYGLSARVVFAQMATEMREQGTVSRTFLGGISMTTALVWPVVMGLAVLSRPIIRTLYGAQWLGAALPLSILMVAHLIVLVYGMNWELCILRNRTGWQARAEATRAIVGLAAFVGGSFIGLGAAACGRVVEGLTGLVIYGPKMREMAGTAKGEIPRVYRQSAMLTLVAVGPSLALMAWHDWSAETPWWQIAPAIATGVVLWLAMLRVLHHRLVDEMALILRKLRGVFAPTGKGGPALL